MTHYAQRYLDALRRSREAATPVLADLWLSLAQNYRRHLYA